MGGGGAGWRSGASLHYEGPKYDAHGDCYDHADEFFHGCMDLRNDISMRLWKVRMAFRFDSDMVGSTIDLFCDVESVFEVDRGCNGLFWASFIQASTRDDIVCDVLKDFDGITCRSSDSKSSGISDLSRLRRISCFGVIMR